MFPLLVVRRYLSVDPTTSPRPKKHTTSYLLKKNCLLFFQTLGEDPKEKGVDIRAELLKFHSEYYSSNLMRLVVLGKGGLDELQAMAVEKFSPVGSAMCALRRVR